MCAYDSLSVLPRCKRKGPRIRRRPISFESLEVRDLLAGTIQPLSVGIDAGGFAPGASNFMFANVMENAVGTWSVCKVGASGMVGINLPLTLRQLDQNGYPIGL